MVKSEVKKSLKNSGARSRKKLVAAEMRGGRSERAALRRTERGMMMVSASVTVSKGPTERGRDGKRERQGSSERGSDSCREEPRWSGRHKHCAVAQRFEQARHREWRISRRR